MTVFETFLYTSPTVFFTITILQTLLYGILFAIVFLVFPSMYYNTLGKLYGASGGNDLNKWQTALLFGAGMIPFVNLYLSCFLNGVLKQKDQEIQKENKYGF